jgi:hypothetical protein
MIVAPVIFGIRAGKPAPFLGPAVLIFDPFRHHFTGSLMGDFRAEYQLLRQESPGDGYWFTTQNSDSSLAAQVSLF